MTLDTQIAVNERLLEREALFSRVHEIESAIDAILGQPYPMPPPPPLPSLSPAYPRRKISRQNSKPPPVPPKPRTLYDDEIGYRVTFANPSSDGGLNYSCEDHTDSAAIHAWMRGSPALPKVLKIETIDEHSQPREIIWPPQPDDA